MGFYATTAPVTTDPPSKNRVRGFRGVAVIRARFPAPQPLETQWEIGSTPTKTAPGLSVWLSRDPLGRVAGINPFEYAGNDPIGSGDLFGLYRFTVGAITFDSSGSVSGTTTLPGATSFTLAIPHYATIVDIQTSGEIKWKTQPNSLSRDQCHTSQQPRTVSTASSWRWWPITSYTRTETIDTPAMHLKQEVETGLDALTTFFMRGHVEGKKNFRVWARPICCCFDGEAELSWNGKVSGNVVKPAFAFAVLTEGIPLFINAITGRVLPWWAVPAGAGAQ